MFRGVCDGAAHSSPERETFTGKQECEMWDDPAPFIASPCTCPGSRAPCLRRSSRGGRGVWRLFFQGARTFASHILTTLVRVCVWERGGGVGARQSITPDTHKAHFMRIKEASTSACVCVCVRVCAYMGCHGLVQACASMRQKERVCVCVCVCVCLLSLSQRALCVISCVRLCA